MSTDIDGTALGMLRGRSVLAGREKNAQRTSESPRDRPASRIATADGVLGLNPTGRFRCRMRLRLQ